MNRTALALAGLATISGVPALAQEAKPAERVIEIEERVMLPAEAVTPQGEPVVIERIIIRRDPAQAGADWVQQDGTVHRFHTMPANTVRSMTYVPSGGAGAFPVPPGGRIVQFDRAAWLAECRDRLSTYEDDKRGEVIGALAGAALGGVLGNRIAGRGNRTLGTVAGVVAGGLAGAAIGDAVEGDPQPSAEAYGECEAYLDDYMASAQSGALSGAPAYYGQEYMLVPVTVTVPQRAVYREVEVEVETKE